LNRASLPRGTWRAVDFYEWGLGGCVLENAQFATGVVSDYGPNL
jgi:hypothetical protein